MFNDYKGLNKKRHVKRVGGRRVGKGTKGEEKSPLLSPGRGSAVTGTGSCWSTGNTPDGLEQRPATVGGVSRKSFWEAGTGGWGWGEHGLRTRLELRAPGAAGPKRRVATMEAQNSEAERRSRTFGHEVSTRPVGRGEMIQDPASVIQIKSCETRN